MNTLESNCAQAKQNIKGLAKVISSRSRTYIMALGLKAEVTPWVFFYRILHLPLSQQKA